MKLRRISVSILLFFLSSTLCAADRVDQPIPPETLKEFTDDLISGKSLTCGLYGRRPVEWIQNATGDEMLKRATSNKFPDDESFPHTSFLYGSFTQKCRLYYQAYRITGEAIFIEQLRQYARLMNWILEDRPWLLLPKERRHERPEDWVEVIPHEPGAPANFLGHVLSARLTLQIAVADRSVVTDEQIVEAEALLKVAIHYLESFIQGNSEIDEKSGLPMKVANLVNATPYNQSFMCYGVLGVAAAGLKDLQKFKGDDTHQNTIDLYTRIVQAGVRKFAEQSDVTKIDGRSYVFRSYSPTDPYVSVRDSKTRQRGPLIIDGHPVFRYPEDSAHSQSAAWYLALLWETDKGFGVNENLLSGIANTHVDYMLRGRAPLTDGTIGPPASILSPWARQALPNQILKPLGKAPLIYAIYLPFHPEIAEASRKLNGRSKKEMDGPMGRQFILFAHYLQALRKNRNLLHLPNRAANKRMESND